MNKLIISFGGSHFKADLYRNANGYYVRGTDSRRGIIEVSDYYPTYSAASSQARWFNERIQSLNWHQDVCNCTKEELDALGLFN